MRKLGWHAAAMALLVAGTADATVIVNGGGPSATARGGMEAYAEDPLAIDRVESYDTTVNDPTGNGATPGGLTNGAYESRAEFDGESTVIGSSASATFGYTFAHFGGSLSGGSIVLSAYGFAGADDSYFSDPDPSSGPPVQGAAWSRAEAVTFMDLEIVGTDYELVFDGAVQDDNEGIDSILSYFVSLADTTGGGFVFLDLFQDATPNDYIATPFASTYTLQAGRTYRIGMGAATDYLCTSTNPALCPALDPNDPVSTPPQLAGSYNQSGSAELNFTLTAVPEPGSALLLGAGLALVAARRRVA